MRVGLLRHRVELQAQTRTVDAGGGAAVAWSTTLTVWASILPARAYERAYAGADKSVATHRVTIRYRDDVSAANRLVWGSRVFDVLGVSDPDGMRAQLDLYVQEVAT